MRAKGAAGSDRGNKEQRRAREREATTGGLKRRGERRRARRRRRQQRREVWQPSSRESAGEGGRGDSRGSPRFIGFRRRLWAVVVAF